MPAFDLDERARLDRGDRACAAVADSRATERRSSPALTSVRRHKHARAAGFKVFGEDFGRLSLDDIYRLPPGLPDG